MKHLFSRSNLGERLRVLAALGLLLAVVLFAFHGAQRLSPTPTSRATTSPLAKSAVLAAYGKLPITFEKNQGQSDAQVKFLAHGNGYTLFLTDGEAVLRLRSPRPRNAAKADVLTPARTSKSGTDAESVVRFGFAASNGAPEVEGLDIQPGHTNYLIGNNPARWQRNVPLYGRVKYHDVYPGIDAIYYGNQDQIETDYIVAPGSDPKRIALCIDGGRGFRLNAQGDLVLASVAGDLILRRPSVYQEIDGKRREIAANYVERSPRLVGVEIASYDSTKPLVVDPVIVYSTYLGGATPVSGNATSSALGIAVDSSGNAYVAGETDTTDFPTTTRSFQAQNKSGAFEGTNGFIAKLNATGTLLVYSTYLGGSGSDGVTGIAIDSSGNAYVTGTTSSLDFPPGAESPIQSLAPTKNNLGAPSGFFAELDPSGANLLYSTYLGGNGTDTAAGIALLSPGPDGNPNAYIVGSTSSIDFPTTANALQLTNNSSGKIFLTQIDPMKAGFSGLLYSTYLGGSGGDSGSAIAVDATSNAYITGTTESSDFPTVNAFQSGLNAPVDTFVARIDTVNSILVYSSFLGGGGPIMGTISDKGNCIAVDSNFNAYVGGQTDSTTFPVTAGAFETTFPSQNVIGTGFVARFDTSKSGAASLIYATFLGGDISGDQTNGIAVDSVGNAYLTGETDSGNFPVTVGAPQTGLSGFRQGFVSVLSADGSKLIFSTYYGAQPSGPFNRSSFGLGLALDTASSPADVFVVGSTTSPSFPTTPGTIQTSLKGLSDAFVAELSPAAAQGVFVTPSSLSFGNQPKGTTSAPQTVTLTNNTQTALSNIVISKTGTNASDFPQSNNCPVAPATLAAASSCTINVIFAPSTIGNENASLQVAYTGSSSPQTVTLSGTGTTPPPGVTLTPSPVNFGSVTQPGKSSQTVTLLNNSTSPLTITSISVVGTTDFTETNNCPTTSALAASTSCAIIVTFTPTATGNETATLQVVDSDPSSPQTDTLNGTGVAPSGSVTVAPTSIAFGNVNINATSPAQTVTLTNSKTTVLTITSVGVAGPNASDFTAVSKCGTSLAASSNCTVSVTFTPAMSAAESATLSIVDSDSTSPQTVALSGTGVASQPDFTISASPTSATVGTHGTVTATITVNSIAGFSSPITLSAGSLPGDSTATFSQNSVTPAANGSATSTVTFQTSAATFASAPVPSPRTPLPPVWAWILAAFAMALLGMWRTAGRGLRRAACAFALFSLVAMASCTGTPSTPTGTYSVQITGKAASVSHSSKFTLTVQ